MVSTKRGRSPNITIQNYAFFHPINCQVIYSMRESIALKCKQLAFVQFCIPYAYGVCVCYK